MFTGLYTALITPFLSDLSLDIDSIGNLVKMQFQSKVDGIILFGTSREGMTITNSEREYIIKYVISLVNQLAIDSK